MSARRSATVFYSRKTLVLWAAAVSAVPIVALGYLLLQEKSSREREAAGLRVEVRKLKEEVVKLKVANQILNIEGARQTRGGQRPAKEKKPPPAPKAISLVFPVGQAIAIVPDRLFVTLARLDGERARIRVAAIREGEKGNRSRTLSPGQSLRFTAEKYLYALVFHSRMSRPPGAHLSIRRVNP